MEEVRVVQNKCARLPVQALRRSGLASWSDGGQPFHRGSELQKGRAGASWMNPLPHRAASSRFVSGQLRHDRLNASLPTCAGVAVGERTLSPDRSVTFSDSVKQMRLPQGQCVWLVRSIGARLSVRIGRRLPGSIPVHPIRTTVTPGGLVSSLPAGH
jgi:hypothetical protein